MLKEFIAQKEWICPPEPAVRIVTDMIEFTSTQVPRFNRVSISGYHIREAGSTAVQELAFTLADGLAYVEAALARGLDVDSFAPRLSFFFDIHNDFFEEIAKLRAARRVWARFMKERYRSEEHTSELQSRLHIVCRLLLEKKKRHFLSGSGSPLHCRYFPRAFAAPRSQAQFRRRRFIEQILRLGK